MFAMIINSNLLLTTPRCTLCMGLATKVDLVMWLMVMEANSATELLNGNIGSGMERILFGDLVGFRTVRAWKKEFEFTTAAKSYAMRSFVSGGTLLADRDAWPKKIELGSRTFAGSRVSTGGRTHTGRADQINVSQVPRKCKCQLCNGGWPPNLSYITYTRRSKTCLFDANFTNAAKISSNASIP